MKPLGQVLDEALAAGRFDICLLALLTGAAS
jgi:hypothetical protein